MPFVALAVGVAIAAIDQIIKFFVIEYLQPVGSITVIENLLDLIYVENRGVAFGLFKDMRWIFVALTSALLIALVIFMFKKKPKKKIYYICSALIIGGGIGNLIDRVFYGYVIDYLSLSFFPPVCNFADYCITIGTVLLIIYIMFFSDFFNSENNKVRETYE